VKAPTNIDRAALCTWWTQSFRNNVWAPLLRRAGLRYRKPHTLRHTYASLLIDMGQALQHQLGYHSAAFTLKVYGHLLPRGDRRAWTPWTTRRPHRSATLPQLPSRETT
jgi:integrase